MARAVTSASALSELRNDLSHLSKTLHDVFDLMTADMSNIGQDWQDEQYKQFKEAYSKQIQKCEDISVQYNRWCTSILDTTIANVEAVEHTNVVGEGNRNSIGESPSGNATAIAGATGIAAMGAGVVGAAGMARKSGGKFGNFNFGASSTMSPAPNQTEAQARWEEDHQMSLDTQNYYIDQNGNAVRKPADYNNTSATSDDSAQSKTAPSFAKSTQEDSKDTTDNSTVSTKNRVCTTNGVDVYGTGATVKTCETTYSDGSKKTEIETCTQAGVSVNGLGGIGGKSVVEGCKVTEKFTPAPSNSTSEDVSGNAYEESGNPAAPVVVTGRRIVPRPKRDASSKAPVADLNPVDMVNPPSVDNGDTPSIVTRNDDSIQGIGLPTGNGTSETNAPTAPLGPAIRSQNPLPGDNPNSTGIPTDRYEVGNMLDHPLTGQDEISTAPFPNVTPADNPYPGVPSKAGSFLGDAPVGSTSANETSVNSSSVNTNTENNTIINNTTINNTTINNTTINNTTINNITQNDIIENQTTENTTITNNISHSISDNNTNNPEPVFKPITVLPSQTPNTSHKSDNSFHDNTIHQGYNVSSNRSDITDIPYTPFPEPGNGPTGKVAPIGPTDDDFARRPSRIIGAFNLGKASTRNGNGTRQRKKVINDNNDSLRSFLSQGDHDIEKPDSRRRKDRFGK